MYILAKRSCSPCQSLFDYGPFVCGLFVVALIRLYKSPLEENIIIN